MSSWEILGIKVFAERIAILKEILNDLFHNIYMG